MRLLHTSDWHIGRTFHGHDLLAEQESVLGRIAELVTERGIDVVVMSGDLYDRAVPAAEAVGVCGRVLARIRAAGAGIVLTAGNHDSAARVGAFGGFAAAGGLHLRTEIATLADPVLLRDEHGEVAVYGIPYLDPDVARRALGTEERGHTAVLTEAMRRIRADLLARGQPRSVVAAHAFVTGANPSESERTIAVGGVEQVPAAVFDGIDYVALGHLHGPQRLAENLRYSGSPLAYSFSEARHHKSVWIVDIGESGLREVHREMLPVPRELSIITGELDVLLSAPEFAEYTEHYLSVTLTDPVRPVDGMRKLQARFPHAVHLDWRPASGETGEIQYAEVIRGRDDIQLADAFIEHCRGDELKGTERELIRTAFEVVAAGED